MTMSDICKCRDIFCKQKENCYRYTAPKDEYAQAYFTESPRKDEECSYFWDNEKHKIENEDTDL